MKYKYGWDRRTMGAVTDWDEVVGPIFCPVCDATGKVVMRYPKQTTVKRVLIQGDD